MLFTTMLKLPWGPNDLYACLCYFFDSVIRDSALHALSCKMVAYITGIFQTAYNSMPYMLKYNSYIIICVQYIDHSKTCFKCVYYINKRRFGDLLHLQVL